MNDLFFELIRIAIGNQVCLSRTPKVKEWQELYAMAKKQSLVGICFAGVQKLQAQRQAPNSWGNEQGELLYLQWMGMAAKIQQRNEFMNKKTAEALSYFKTKGLACQVLKGQGIAQLYCEYRQLRQSGDIDVWVTGSRDDIYKLSCDVLGYLSGVNYHHIHFPIWKDPEIELHIYPSFLSSPKRNNLLQEFCKKYIPTEGCSDTPPLSFNRLYILLHCYRHFAGHGVGFRQILDYYYVLKEGFTEEEKEMTITWISKLGMERFANAMMWLMKEILGLEDDKLICEPNERYGKFLLSEVLQTGNMGHADSRVNKSNLNSSMGRYIYNIKRDLQVVRICPHESLWEPWFNLILYLRRKFIWSNNYNLKNL